MKQGNRRRLIVLTGLLAAMTLAGNAWAQGRGRGGGMGRGWMRHVKGLDLSAQQRQKVGELRVAMITKTAPVKAQVEVKRAELRQLWQAKSPSKQAIVRKMNEIDALHRQLRDARVDFRLGVIAVLTPAQRAKLQSAIAAGPRFHSKRGKRGKRGQRFFGGPRQGPGWGAGPGGAGGSPPQ